MTKEQYLEFHRKKCEEMMEITRRKNSDYSGSSPDPFANFTKVRDFGICSVEAGFLTRMTDKLSRICSFAQKGELQVRDESVTDTLLDLANYCILMAGYLESKKEVVALGPNDLSHEQKEQINDHNKRMLDLERMKRPLTPIPEVMCRAFDTPKEMQNAADNLKTEHPPVDSYVCE